MENKDGGGVVMMGGASAFMRDQVTFVLYATAGMRYSERAQ